MIKISKVFFQTSKRPLNFYLQRMIKSRLTDGWVYRHFTDTDIIHYIKSHPLKELPNAVEFFQRIKGGEHKADFFRYYFLYVNGGVFMDSDAMIYETIDNIVRDFKFFSVNSSIVPGTIFQGLLGAEAGNPLIYRALKSFYSMDLALLDNRSNYHILCKDLYTFYNENPEKDGYHLYSDIHDYSGDKTIDENGNVLFRHYWRDKDGIPNTIKSRNLVYCCVFFNNDYLKLLNLLLKSMKMFSKIDSFDFLVVTQKDFEPMVKQMALMIGLDIRIFCIDCTTIFQAACARLRIFEYPQLENYEKLLYIDTDIIIKENIEPLFELEIDDLLYGIESGTIESLNFGGQFFDFQTIDSSLTGLNSGTLLFKNTTTMSSLFSRILEHIEEFTKQGNKPPYCMDQPFINYHAVKDYLYNNQLLNPHVSLFEGNDTVDNYTTSSICHFSFPIGNFQHKFHRMKEFLNKTLNKSVYSNIPPDIIGKKYSWGAGYIKFLINYEGILTLETCWSNGSFNILGSHSVCAYWNNCFHILKFNEDFSEYLAIKTDSREFEISTGYLIESFINIYGDSHAALSFRDCKLDHRNLFQFSKTMYRIGRDNTIINFNSSHNNPNTIFCLAYGEVDVRAHVGKQVHYGRHHETVCKELVESYFKTIKNSITSYKEIIIVGISPAVALEDHTRTDHKHDPALPFIGTNSDRVIYTNELNKLIKAYCSQYGYIYFNPYSEYTRDDGCLNYSLSDSCIHIGKNTHFLSMFYRLYQIIENPVIPIVLHTCDKYKQFWNPWMFFVKKYIKKPYKIYFLSEEEDPDFIDDVIVIKTGKGEWGKRLLDGLKIIPEKYIYYMQEDFWPCKPIDLSIYSEYFVNHGMDALRISGNSYLYNLDKVSDNLYKFSQNSNYLMTHQFSLWDKEYFMKYINIDDNPWKNEIEQSKQIAKSPHSIYLMENSWYNATVRKGVLEPIGVSMLQETLDLK